MNSKERVLTTISHNEPDRVPTSMNASPWVLYRLKKALGVSSDKELMARLNIDIFDMRGIDGQGKVIPRYIGPACHRVTSNGELLPLGCPGMAPRDMWGIELKVVDTPYGKMFQHKPPPLSDAESLKELENYDWPNPDWFEYDTIPIQLEQWSDYAVLCSGASIFQHPTFLRGMDKLLMDLVLNPDMANFIIDKFTDFYYEYFRRIFNEAGDMIDIFWIADDFGGQDNLIISPELFREFFVPRLKRLIGMAKEYNIKVLLHSDGNIRPIIPILIDLGVDILDPIQPEAKDMNPKEIKEEFGDKLCLRGGISVQKVLSKGTEHEVREEIKKRIEQLAPGGGYILSPGHPVLQVDIPTKNIIAMYEAAQEYGSY